MIAISLEVSNSPTTQGLFSLISNRLPSLIHQRNKTLQNVSFLLADLFYCSSSHWASSWHNNTLYSVQHLEPKCRHDSWSPSVFLAVLYSLFNFEHFKCVIHVYGKDCTEFGCCSIIFVPAVGTMFESGRKDKTREVTIILMNFSCSAIGYKRCHLYLPRVTCALGNACFWHGDEPDFCSSTTPLQNPHQSFTPLCVYTHDPTATRLQHELIQTETGWPFDSWHLVHVEYCQA